MTVVNYSRRQVLTLAGLCIGVGTIELSGAAPAAAAPDDARLTLEPISDHAVPVLSDAPTTPDVCPRQLAVQVLRNGVVLPAGTTASLTFDPRLFAPVEPAVVML